MLESNKMNRSGNLTVISCLIFIFLFAALSTEAAVLNDSIQARQEALRAALEYEYQFYKAADNASRANYLMKEAEAFSSVSDFSRAMETLDRIDFSNISDSMQREVHRQLAFTSYLGEDFEKSESHLLRYESICKDSSQLVGMLPLYSLVLNELNRWQESRIKLEAYVRMSAASDDKQRLLKQVDSLYTMKSFPKLKNLRKAQTLSAFFPGLGQMYAGYFWDGVTSSAIVAGTVAFTVYSVITAHYFTAAVIGYGLASKFYQGGIKHLEYLVAKTNFERTRSYNDKLKARITGMMLNH